MLFYKVTAMHDLELRFYNVIKKYINNPNMLTTGTKSVLPNTENFRCLCVNGDDVPPHHGL